MTLAIVSSLLQQRHAFYRTLLAVEVVALVISVVAVLRDSPLLGENRLDPSPPRRCPAPSNAGCCCASSAW